MLSTYHSMLGTDRYTAEHHGRLEGGYPIVHEVIRYLKGMYTAVPQATRLYRGYCAVPEGTRTSHR